MNDLAFFSLHSSKNALEERLLRDTLDFSTLGSRNDLLFSWRWHFLLGTLPMSPQGVEAHTAACRAACAAWVRQWQNAGHRLSQTLRSSLPKQAKTVKFDESSSSSRSSSEGETLVRSSGAATATATASTATTTTTENPLVPSVESSYALQFEADAVRQSVAKDMSRLFWDVPLFRDPTTKAAVSDILLKYCLAGGKEYKQGFHELVAFLYDACHRDRELVHRLMRDDPTLRSNPYVAVFDAAYADLPAAVYALFRRMVTEDDGGLGLSRWYYVENLKEQSGVVVACERVQQDLLLQVAPELQHLLDAEYDIQSVVYLVRWLRLLFLRELSFEQVRQVWTVLFTERYVTTARGTQPYVIDNSVALYFAVQLLLHIRTALSSDAGAALQLLMKYPPIEHVHDLLYRAIMSNADSSLARYATAPRLISAVDAVALPADVTARQGEILARVISSLEQHWFREPGASAEEQKWAMETYIQSIAQLKRVRDVLLYGLGE